MPSTPPARNNDDRHASWPPALHPPRAGWPPSCWPPHCSPGCGYNDFQRLDEQVKSAWSEVLNLPAPRRPDPQIVATVQGEANFEQEPLTARDRGARPATAIQARPNWSTTRGLRQVPGRAG